MVHGDVLDSEMTWSEQRELADHRQLLLVDRRGFGQSPDVEGEDFEVDAADIADLLPTGAHLVGHSYGGVVSLLAAARRPDAVRSLTVVEPPAFGLVRGRSDVEAFISTVERVVEADPSPAEFLPQFLTAVGVDPGRLPDPLPPPLVRHAATQLHGRWPWEAEIPLDTLAGAALPTLVVSGGHSAMFDAVCDVLEARFGAQRVVIPGAGHTVPSTGRPFNEALSAFWDQVERA